MKYLVSTDWHAQPDDYRSFIAHLEYIEEWLKAGNHAILHEQFNALENGWRAYRSSKLLMDLVNLQIRYENLDILQSNHAHNCPWLKMKESVTYDNILFCHGHQFDRLWRWWKPTRIPLPDWIQRLYLTPAKKKANLKDYHLASLDVMTTALKETIRLGLDGVCIGHTHLPGVMRPSVTYGNSGDRVDNFSWLEIDTETNNWLLKGAS